MLLISACSQVNQPGQLDLQPTWTPDDLLYLDPADSSDPDSDILAVYLREQRRADLSGAPDQPWLETLFPRQNPDLISIRLDLLDLQPEPGADYSLALDYTPGGSADRISTGGVGLNWDILISIPAGRDVSAVRPDGSPVKGIKLSVWRDPIYDTLTVTFDPAALPLPILDRLRMQASSLNPQTGRILDSTAVMRLTDPAPHPVRYLLAFRSAFPGATPAQALRRWDGAHTGPLGGRHGLYNLLRITRNYAVPLLLVDLNHPDSLSALDYAGDLQLLQEFHARHLLLLPSAWAPAGGNAPTASQFRLSGDGFMVIERANPSSNNGYAQNASVFFSPNDPDQHQNLPVLPIDFDQLATGGAAQPDLSGISVDTRSLLAAGAGQILLLGGDLPGSAWGAPEYARAALSYIKAHPWLQPATRYDLLELPAAPASLPGLSQGAITPLGAPGPELAYTQALESLHAPIYPHPPDLPALRGIYREELDNLQAAIEWQRHPYSLASCDSALNPATNSYCILASQVVFALLDPRSGGLAFLFARSGDQVHQLIGPGWQFSLGSSDPAAWDLSAGAFADPDTVPAAFARKGASLIAETSDSSLSFADAGSRITYTLTPTGLQVALTGEGYAKSSIPLALDPWTRFTPGWALRYAANPIPSGFRWQIDGESAVEVTGDANLSLQAFNDSRGAMGAVENPNTDYPPGHYLPFPLALVEVRAQNGSQLSIQLAR